MKAFKSESSQQTQDIAASLAKEAKPGTIFALIGDLGAGKTIFTQGFAKGLGILDKIISPTFILIRQYPIPSTQNIFYHLDLYRLENHTDFKSLGISEIIQNPQAIVLIEWAEKIKKLLPPNTIYINFKVVSENIREIQIEKL